MRIAATNRQCWERIVEEGAGCTVPWLDLDRTVVCEYAAGRQAQAPKELLTMHPAHLLRDVGGKDVLCLASGGGQQSAVFGLLGARVTVLDLAEGQLEGDRKAAAHYGYEVTTLQWDMRDLSGFGEESFGLVWQASSAYIPDVRVVYSEVARVLKTGGWYRAEFTNPATEFVHEEWDGVGYRIVRPYAERTRRRADGALEFRHYLGDIFNGLLDVGLSLQQVEEDPSHLLQDPQAQPGSWEHLLQYLVAFAVVARKEPRRK